MECLIGMQCQDFVILAADMMNMQSILVMKSDENKIVPLSSKVAMAVCGEIGDRLQFSEYIAKNVALYKMRNNYELSPYSAAFFTRGNLAEALRSHPYNVNLLLGGYDDKNGGELYYIDYLGSLKKLQHYAVGYGGFFSNAIMDRCYRPNLTQMEAYDIVKSCVKEVQKRLLVNLPNFKVQVIDKNGISDLPVITNKD